MKRPFVGRQRELRALLDALTGGTETTVLWVVGATGIGKTALLLELEEACRTRGVEHRRLDARRDAITQASLETAIEALGRAPDAKRRLLLIDHLEELREIERWLAGRLRVADPRLTIVIADRQPACPVWFDADAAFAREVPLGPLAEAEVDAYLDDRAVPDEQRAAIVKTADGHPLLLSVACDCRTPSSAEDHETRVLLRLAASLCDACDSAEKRLAAAVAVTATGTTYELLVHLFSDERVAHAIFQWLRSLSVFDETSRGLVPHALVRRACSVYLRTHHPSLYRTAQHAWRTFESRLDVPHLGSPSPDETPSAPPFLDDDVPSVFSAVRDADEFSALDVDAAHDQTFRRLLERRLGELAVQSKLTEREREVFGLLVLGRNTHEIGSVLGVTPRTAKFHQARVLEKIGADSRFDILRLLL